MRGRNRGKSHNPLTRVYKSNGPDVKIRGTANHVAEKYIQLARDATASGDPVAAENYYQHAEHYFRLIAAAQEQFRQNQPFQQQPRPEGGSEQRADDNFDDGDESMQPHSGGGEPHSPRDQQHRPIRSNRSLISNATSSSPTNRANISSKIAIINNAIISRTASTSSISPGPTTGHSRPAAAKETMFRDCRPSSPADRRRKIRAMASRTAMTISPTVSRCTGAAGAAIAVRAPICRAGSKA